MKKFYLLLLLTSFFVAGLTQSYAQQCDASVPVFTVNMSGNPNGSWISTPVVRNGLCCTASGADKCLEFVITLDSSANGIKFEIASGAVPGGAMYYEVNCGPPAQVGDPICLSGPGPHHLTFCKPGNNTNTYKISSIPKPSIGGTRWVSQACSGLLGTQGLVDTSIHWTSLPSNPIYNSYLSCMNGCDSVTVTPTGAFPSYVDYQVCGYVIGGCYPVNYCDTIRVNFVNDLAVNILPKNQTICFGAGLATVTANPIGGKAPYFYNWSTGATTQSINVGAGTYTVVMNDSMNCSTAYDTVSVFAFASAIDANAGPDQLLCIGDRQSVSLNGIITAASGGIWSGSTGSFNPSDTARNVIYTPSVSEITAGFAQLMLITTGNAGCPADTDMIQISIAPQPDPVVTGSTSPCQYKPYTYSASCPTPVSYSWSITGGTFTSPNGNNTINVLWNTAGSRSITLLASNTAGCDTTITIPVTINPTPTPSLTGPSSACVPTTATYSLASSTGNILSWTVTGGSIIGTTSNSVSVQWTSPGTGTVSVKETNSFGCDSSVSVTVILNPQPNPVVSGSFTLCENTTSVYAVTCSVPASFQWSVTGGTIISPNMNNSVIVQWNNSGSASITLVATHAAGCDSVITIPVTIHPKPTPAITGIPVICTPSASTFSLSSPVTNTFNWTVSGGTVIGSSTGTSIDVQWNFAGSGYVSVIETNSFGCDSSINIPVTLNSYPLPVLQGRPKVCVQDTAQYWVPKVPGHTYQWKVVGGSIVSFTVDNSIDVYWYAVGVGSVSLREFSPTGCDSSDAISVMVNAKPAPAITGSLSVCENQNEFYNGLNHPGSAYFWTANGGNISGSSSQASSTIHWTTLGNGSINLLEIDSNGCTNNTNIPIFVNARPNPTITGSKNVCLNQKMNTYSSPSQTGISYQWTVDGGNIVGGNGTSSISVLWSSAGTYSVALNKTNLSTGCDSTTILTVIVDSLPKPIITTSGLTGCAPLNVSFLGNQTPGNNIYYWKFGDGQTSYSSNPAHQYNNPGSYTVSLIATNANGCVDSTKATVVTYPSPVSYFISHVSPDFYFANTSPFTLQNLSTGAIKYEWDFGNGDTSKAFEPKYQYNSPGTYVVTLTVTNSYGCTDVIQGILDIKVPEDLFIPNAFTPNGDHHNESFKVYGRNIVDLSVRIFNRWGQQLYYSNDKDFTWDGTYNGKEVEQAVYVYQIKGIGYEGKVFDKVGTVTVVR